MYKRQVDLQRAIELLFEKLVEIGIDIILFCRAVADHIPVSYTHLDVYKRQDQRPERALLFWREISCFLPALSLQGQMGAHALGPCRERGLGKLGRTAHRLVSRHAL